MDEIKVGEYIRTKHGHIRKVDCINYLDEIVVDDMVENEFEDKKWFVQFKDVVKHSKNIIDLIGVGDLIQLKGAEELKYEVLKISYDDLYGKHIHIINPFRTEGGKDIFIEDIKSIVTKEQFAAAEYRLED